MAGQKYIIAVRRQVVASVPPDWQERLGRIPGVSVQGAAGRQAQFVADSEAIERVRREFSDDFLIEESSDRSPMGAR